MAAGVTVALAGLLDVLGAADAARRRGAGRAGRRRRRGPLRDLARGAARGERARLANVRARRASCSRSAPPASPCWRTPRSPPRRSATSPRPTAANAGVRTVVGLVAVAQLAVAAAWWRRAEGAPTWGEVCVIALDVPVRPRCARLPVRLRALRGRLVGQPHAARRPVRRPRGRPRDRVHRRRRPAARAAGRARPRPRGRARARTARGGDRQPRPAAPRAAPSAASPASSRQGLDIALQPIVDLDSRRVVGAEALARFADERADRMPTEETFLDAHTLGMGVELELAIAAGAANEERLPEGMYLALNVSPALLASGELEDADRARPPRGPAARGRAHRAPGGRGLRRAGRRSSGCATYGVRVAVDDVGSGFASFRHVTRVNPEILKLDRSLVCGIDEDPVRQSLASAIVSFARDVGAIVVSEGIESESELSCLMDLAVGCGQGFYLGRPGLGRVEPRVLSEPQADEPRRGCSPPLDDDLELEVAGMRRVVVVAWALVLVFSGAAADGPGVGTPTVVASATRRSPARPGAGRATRTDSYRTPTRSARPPTTTTPGGEAIPGCHRSKAAEVHIGGGVNSEEPRLLGRHGRYTAAPAGRDSSRASTSTTAPAARARRSRCRSSRRRTT